MNLILAQATDLPAVPAEALKWTLIVIASLFLLACAGIALMRSFRQEKLTLQDEPPIQVAKAAKRFNHDLAEQRHVDHERRLRDLEDWQRDLTKQLERDKAEIIDAGEQRASRLHQHIEADRVAMDAKVEANRRELSEKIDGIPAQVITILKNTNAI